MYSWTVKNVFFWLNQIPGACLINVKTVKICVKMSLKVMLETSQASRYFNTELWLEILKYMQKSLE